MKRKWQVLKKISEEFRNRFPEVNPIILQLLHNRGLETQEQIDEFLNPDFGQDVHDPFLFFDMRKAVSRIMAAIEKKERITVHGDYDADGVTATAIAVSALRALGADVDVYIPHRMSEGYGMNNNTVQTLADQGTKLIVTVDCGISNKPEVELANSLGMDVIVTDHHEPPPELPEAFAILNPHRGGEQYPFKPLAGSGVAFKLVQALVKTDDGKLLKAGFEKWLMDLVAIGTIADCVPLVGENRTLSKYGLVVLRKTRNIGLQALAEIARTTLATVDSSSVAFSLVPRLNAAGRIDHANTAYELLITDDRSEAERLAESMETNNRKRQRTTEVMVRQAKEQFGDVKKRRILFAKGEGWSPGIVGLVAGRLMDEYNRPVIVMGDWEGEVIGSGRSIPAFDITAALIQSSKTLERFGGHAAACGFTVKPGQVDAFTSSMEKLAAQSVTDTTMVKRLVVDGEVTFAEIDWEVANALDEFEPFGEQNRRPQFLIHTVEIVELRKLGQQGKHLKITGIQEGVTRKLLAFNRGETWGNELAIGEKIDIVAEVAINEWNGRRDLEFKLTDLLPSAVN